MDWSNPNRMISPVAHIVVGVADMTPVTVLWQDRFGLVEVANRWGPDKDLSRIWNLADDAVAEQLLLRTPHARGGWLHFVRFKQPHLPVRQGAATTDLCPKNLDVNCIDMPARYDELASDGYVFRSAINEYNIGDLAAREVQFDGHDCTNVVLIEVDGWPIKLSPQNFGAVSSFVVVVADPDAEAEFYRCLFGHQELMHHRIAGAAIEKTVGLPTGAALDMRLLGCPHEAYGRLELITYEGASGRNLFPMARPPALGALLCRLEVEDADVVLQRAAGQGYDAVDHGLVKTIFGYCRLVTITTPAGFTVEAFTAESSRV